MKFNQNLMIEFHHHLLTQ